MTARLFLLNHKSRKWDFGESKLGQSSIKNRYVTLAWYLILLFWCLNTANPVFSFWTNASAWKTKLHGHQVTKVWLSQEAPSGAEKWTQCGSAPNCSSSSSWHWPQKHSRVKMRIKHVKKKVLFLLQLKARDVATLTDYAESCGRSLSAMLKPCELELLTVTVVLVPFGAMEEIIWWISLLYIYAVTYTNSPFSGTLLNFWGIWFNLIIYTYSILYFLYKRTPYPIKWEHWGNA